MITGIVEAVRAGDDDRLPGLLECFAHVADIDDLFLLRRLLDEYLREERPAVYGGAESPRKCAGRTCGRTGIPHADAGTRAIGCRPLSGQETDGKEGDVVVEGAVQAGEEGVTELR